MNQNSNFRFELLENPKLRKKDLVQLMPYGLSLAPDMNRPILLLKSANGEHTLPVALNPLEAGVALTQFNKTQAPVTPHRVTESLLASLDVKIEKCIFVEIKGQFQYVRLYLSGHPHLKSMKFRADEAMSLCLHLNVDFYATFEFVNASKAMSLQTQSLNKDLQLVLQEKGQGYIQ